MGMDGVVMIIAKPPGNAILIIIMHVGKDAKNVFQNVDRLRPIIKKDLSALTGTTYQEVDFVFMQMMVNIRVYLSVTECAERSHPRSPRTTRTPKLLYLAVRRV